MSRSRHAYNTEVRDPEAGLKRKLPFGAPVVAVLVYLLSMPIGQMIWGEGDPSGATVGAMLAVLGFVPVLGAIGLVASVRGLVAKRRRGPMIVALVLNTALIVASAALWLTTRRS